MAGMHYELVPKCLHSSAARRSKNDFNTTVVSPMHVFRSYPSTSSSFQARSGTPAPRRKQPLRSREFPCSSSIISLSACNCERNASDSENYFRKQIVHELKFSGPSFHESFRSQARSRLAGFQSETRVLRLLRITSQRRIANGQTAPQNYDPFLSDRELLLFARASASSRATLKIPFEHSSSLRVAQNSSSISSGRPGKPVLTHSP